MKTIILCFLLISSNFLNSQVRLDSIVISEIITEEVVVSQIYSYDSEGLLTKYTEPQYDTEFDIVNNEDNQIERIDFIDPESGMKYLELHFQYSAEKLLDTVSFFDVETSLIDFFLAFTYENGLPVNLSQFQLDSDLGIYVNTQFSSTSYENGNRLKRESFYYDYVGNAVLYYIEEYEYEGDQLIKINYIDPTYQEVLYYDSMKYNSAGSLEKLMEVSIDYVNPDELDISTTEYDYETGQDITGIVYPKEFFEVNYELGFDEYRYSRLAFMVDRPMSLYSEADEEKYDFYYSVFLGLDERQPAKRISIYPNPVGDYLTIEDLDNIETVDIYSMTGSKVLSLSSSYLDETAQKFLVSDLNSGMYTVVISTKSNEYYFASMLKE